LISRNLTQRYESDHLGWNFKKEKNPSISSILDEKLVLEILYGLFEGLKVVLQNQKFVIECIEEKFNDPNYVFLVF
jgi:hypothetical protein